jgi:tRNA G18 (ribose-2'-O)-methylase SpoU
MEKRGYFGIGMFEPKYEENLGGLFRSAHFLGANFIFTIGARYEYQHADTSRAERHIPYYAYKDIYDFKDHLPEDIKLIAVDIVDEAEQLETFIHPERAIYILGGEDRTLRDNVLRHCDAIVKFTSKHSLNVAVAGAIVMYDRHLKQIIKKTSQ